MRIGIVGLPQSGKTTTLHALAGVDRAVSAFSAGRLKIQTTTMSVPDERVDNLGKLFNLDKTVYTQVTFADIAGLDKDLGKSSLPGPFVNHISQMDEFLHVLRAFDNNTVAHDPMRDLATLETEFLFNDLLTVERRIERLTQSIQKGAEDREQAAKEKVLFERLKNSLESEQPLRSLELTVEEKQNLRGYGFLTIKPVLIVLNTDESSAATELSIDQPQVAVSTLRARLESELNELSEDDAALFMHEYGIDELGRFKIIRLSYDLLNVLSFFTFNEEEVRAWTLPQGSTALHAAAAVHSDLAKGFIRAEVISYPELIALGGTREAKTAGKLRLEGKQYIVQDGDIIRIRHNI